MEKFLLFFGLFLCVLGTTPEKEEVQIVHHGGESYAVMGDTLISMEEWNARKETKNKGARVKRQVNFTRPKWTNNTVYFYFTDEINDKKRTAIRTAAKYIEARTCINFIEDSKAKNVIQVTLGGNICASWIGMRGGNQPFYFGMCNDVGSALHELMHALGSTHTQDRPDRDEYLYLACYAETWKLAYEKHYNKTPYEYGSIVHYPYDTGFIPKDERYSHTTGNGEITFYDLEMMNQYYGCHEKCNIPTAAQCKHGGVPLPRNCSVCMCPTGYGGRLCDERPPGCGETFVATPYWQNQSMYVSGSEKIAAQDPMYRCNNWIEAPAGKQIEIKILHMSNERCASGCTTSAMEIKTEADLRITNPRICCREHYNTTVFKSLNNPTAIVSFDSSNPNGVSKIKFRYVDAPPTTTSTTTTTTTRATTTKTSTTTTTPTTTTNYIPYIPRKCEDRQKTCKPERCVYDPKIGNITSLLKLRCGKTCDLCGKFAGICYENSGYCKTKAYLSDVLDKHPMVVEYECPETFGFCENPN